MNGGRPTSISYSRTPSIGIGRRADLLRESRRLLRRHVGGRSHDRPGMGALDAVELLGQAEIRDLGGAVRGHEHVGGLEVAVDDAGLVRGVDRTSNALAQAGCFGERQQRVADLAGEASPFHVLQGEEGLPVVLADFVDLNDVRMLDAGDGLGLATEADDGVRLGACSGKNHLQGDQAFEASLLGLVDHAHAALAQFAEDHVAADGGEPQRR